MNYFRHTSCLLGVWICLVLSMAVTQPAGAQTQEAAVRLVSGDDTVITPLEQQLAMYQKSFDWAKATDVLREIARYYIDHKKQQKAQLYLEKAIRAASLYAPQKMPSLYADLSFYYTRFSDPVKSLEYALKAVKLAETDHLSGAALGDIYNKTAMSYSDFLRHDSAFIFGKKAIAAAEQTADTELILSSYFNLAITQADLHRPAEAKELTDELTRKYPSQDPTYLFMVYYLYTHIYLNTQDFKQADIYFDKLQKVRNQAQQAPIYLNFFLFTAIRYYTETQQYALAKPYLLLRDQMIRENFDPVMKASNEEYLFMADSATGNYFGAIGHLEEYFKWRDSLFSLDKARQINQLQVAFNSDKKDRDIKLLQQSGELKDVALRNQIITRNVSIGGVLVLLLLLGIIYNRYQLKQRSNKALQQKQDEINRQNETLKKLLTEKEWLLREIHHRVKNNLQIVISLLNTQSAYLNNEDAIEAIRNSQHRMHAMSLIHQKLYQTDNLAFIDMEWYIRELVAYMKECFDTGIIQFRLETTAVKLDVAQAVPLGLILNEAISNAIKYAFPGHRKGIITIELKMQSDKLCRLRIADDGTGMPTNFDIEESTSLGMSLMRGLSNQLEASFEVQQCGGTIVSVVFPLHSEALNTPNIEEEIKL